MIQPRWHKVTSDLWSSKIRSLLVIASIAVGLFATGLITCLHYYLSADMPDSYAKVNPANIMVVASPFTSDLVDRIQHLPGVKQAEGIWNVGLRLKTGPDELIPINIRGFEKFSSNPIGRVDVIQGSWPPGNHEVALETNKLADTHAKLGDFIEIRLPSGTVRNLKVVAIVHDLTIGSSDQNGGFFLAPVQGYVDFDTLEWLEQPKMFNQLNVTVSVDQEDVAAIGVVANRISKEFDNNGISTQTATIHRTHDHPNSIYVDAISKVLYLLGFFVVFLSAFLITNTLSALLNLQVQQIGIMKTIGARSGQIISIYMLLIFVFGLLALGISVPLANPVAYQITKYLALRVNYIPQGFRAIPNAVLLQTAVAMIVPQIAGILPILRGSRVTVQEAISGIAAGSGDERLNFIDRLGHRVRGISRPILVSLRNTFRSKTRLALTLTTLTLGGAIFIATFSVQTSLTQYIHRLESYFQADVGVTLDQPYRIDDVRSLLLQVPGVAETEGWAAARTEVMTDDNTPGETVGLQAPPADSRLITPILISGRWIQPGDENAIALNERFLDLYPNLKLGDTLRLKVNGNTTSWIVVGFFQFAGKSAGFVAYTDYNYLAKITHIPNKSSSFRVVASNGPLNLDQQKALGRRIESVLDANGYHVSEISSGLDIIATTSGGLDTLTNVLLIMAILTALVGSIGLAGTMSMNVLERTREIGILRAIGASDSMIMKMVLVEGLVIGGLSWILGALLAIPISRMMSDAVCQVLFNSNSTFRFNFTGFGIWLVLVIVLSLLASIIPARNAARLTIREVLAYE